MTIDCGHDRGRGAGHVEQDRADRVAVLRAVVDADQQDKRRLGRHARREGDRVLFSKYGGTEVKVDGEELLVLREEDIMGVVEG